MLKNLSIKSNILFAISSLMIGLIIVSFVAFSGFKELRGGVEELAKNQIPLNNLVSELQKDILEEEILLIK